VAGHALPKGEDGEPCEAARTGHEMWDSWGNFCSGYLARSTRGGGRRIGHNVAVGCPPQGPQFGENDLSRNSRPKRTVTPLGHAASAPAILLVA
jgi:hypothetical protein